jgi:hypothetical protein
LELSSGGVDFPALDKLPQWLLVLLRSEPDEHSSVVVEKYQIEIATA